MLIDLPLQVYSKYRLESTQFNMNNIHFLWILALYIFNVSEKIS